MKNKRTICTILLVAMFVMMAISGCGKVELPTTTSEELGVYVMYGKFVDANGEEILDDAGAPMYAFDKDHNAVTLEDGSKKTTVIIAAEYLTDFSCVTEVEAKQAVTVNIPVFKIENASSDIYGTFAFDMPIKVGPANAINKDFTIESYDPNTLKLDESDIITVVDSDEYLLKVTALYSGEAKVIVKNCLGEIIGTVNVTIKPEVSKDEAAIKAVEDKIAKCKHEFKDEVVATTETAGGYTQHTCSVCGYMFRDKLTEKLPCKHDFTERTVKATCTEKGYTLATCSKCGAVEKKNFTDLAPHTYKVETVAASCAAQGYSCHECTVCGYVEKDNFVARTPHTFIDTTVEPTYTSMGYTQHRCSVCGYSYSDSYIPPVECTDHIYVETSRDEATCYSEGYRYMNCTRCGKADYEIIPTTSHTYNDSAIAPTCIADGYIAHTCSVCGCSYKDNIVSAVGHEWEGHEEECQIGAEMHYICNMCGLDENAAGQNPSTHACEYDGMVYLWHSWHTSNVLYPVYGIETVYTCTRCGATQ